MSYHGQLRKAYYRGIFFELPDDDTDFSPRVARHETPGRDGATHEPLGLQAENFTVTAIVAGDDFMSRADALQQALKKQEAGQLIHPHYGERLVIVLKAQRRHDSGDVGVVRFDIEFEEYGEPQYPSALRDTAAAMGAASNGLFGAIEAAFNENFKWSGIPDFLTADIISRATGFVGDFKELLSDGGVLDIVVGRLPSWVGIDGSFVTSVTGLFKDIVSLTRPQSRPVIGSAAARISDAQRMGIISALGAAGDVSVALDTSAATATAATRVKNAQALDGLFRGCALAALGGAARYASYDSKEAAIAFRDTSALRLESLSDAYGRAGWDDAWRAAGTMRASLTRDINDRIGRLPYTLKVRAQAVLPSMAIANRLYGDDATVLFERAEDIVRRNGVRHPGFVPAGELEVLVDAS